MAKQRFPSFSEKLAPHDEEAEEWVIGSILLDETVLRELDFLSFSDFHDDRNGQLFKSCLRLQDKGESINMITVRQDIEQRMPDVETEWVGDYLREIYRNTPTPTHAAWYGRRVRATALRRQIMQAAARIAERAYNETEPQVVMEQAFGELEGLYSQMEGNIRRLHIKGVKKVTSDPPKYNVYLNSATLTRVPWETLSAFKKFKSHVAERLDFIPATIEQGVWETRLNRLLETIEIDIAPADASEQMQVMMAIAKIVRDSVPAVTMEDVGTGRPADKGQYFFFRSDQLLRLLRDRHAVKIKSDDLWGVLNLHNCVNQAFRMGGKVAKGWGVPRDLVEKMVELGVEEEEEAPLGPEDLGADLGPEDL